MKLPRRSITFLFAVTLALRAFAVDPETEPDVVRPTGIEKSPAKEHSSKPKRARSAIRSSEDDVPIVSTVPGGSVPATGAKSVMIVDAHSGQILYEKNADELRPAASTQKLLTALIVAEHGFLDQPVQVEVIDTMAEPVKLNIKPGDTYQRIDLLRALLVKSPNDVARCLARDHAGSIEAFAEVMNRRALALGATHSHFINPNGLPMPGQYSSARDLSLIARAAYANPTSARLFVFLDLSFATRTAGRASLKIRTKF